MKKIINGTRYDTDKAELIGRYSYSNSRDFNFLDEALYVTPQSKKYFLAGEGGANTKYSRSVSQNSWSGGEKIQPLSRQDALAWAERYLNADDVEEFFGDMIQDA